MELDSAIWILSDIQKERVTAFIIDETVIQIGHQHFWLWFCIEPIHISVLGIYISEEREICLLLKKIYSFTG
jgi:putative transposase